jgi:hypothetical protein
MNRTRSRLVCITSYDARTFRVCSQLLSLGQKSAPATPRRESYRC